MAVLVDGEMTGSRLRELLSFDPETGVFTWKQSRGGVWAGTKAGLISAYGYRRIKVAGRIYSAHRLAWLYLYDHWPLGEIDHRDGDRLNNKASNLRIATSSQNSANMRPRESRAVSKGVRRQSGRRHWEARITVNRKDIYLGTFATETAAHAAYCAAAKVHFGAFSRSV